MKQLSENTKRAYRTASEQYTEYCLSVGKPFAMADYVDSINGFYDWLVSNGMKPNTAEKRKIAMRSCVEKLTRTKGLDGKAIKRAGHRHKDAFSEKEVRDIYQWLITEDDLGDRMKAVALRLLIETGCRKSEVLNMTWGDLRKVGDDYFQVQLLKTKERRPRTVMFSREVAFLIGDIMWDNKYTGSDPLLRAKQHKTPMSGPVLNKWFNISEKDWPGTPFVPRAKGLGLLDKNKYITPHSTRVTAKNILEKHGIGQLTINDYMGHSNAYSEPYSWREDSPTKVADVLCNIWNMSTDKEEEGV